MSLNVQHLLTDHIDLWTSAIENKSSTGRGSSRKQTLYGIKKLRELILELAVRGKLVPQDPNDEPASELLKRIEAERDQLVKEGKIKKPKKLPEISDEEKPFELPEGWEWVKLGSLGITQTGGAPQKSNQHHYGSDIPFIKPGDISNGRVDCYDNDGLSLEGALSLGRVARSNSILMVCIGTIGKCARVDRDICFNQQINAITPYIDISAYINRVFQAPYFQHLAWENSSSTTIAILNKGKWENILFALAPHHEQHRIVAKVDELMALCDQLEQQTEQQLDAHQQLVDALLDTLTQSQNADELADNWSRLSEHFDTLFTTEASIDQLKQTILQLAVMGKLVPQNPNDEPASELLKRITAEKAQLIKDGKIKKQKPLPPISEEEKPFALPEGWEWVRMDDISTKITDGAHHTPTYTPYGIPFLSVKDMSSGLLSFEDTRFISLHQHQELIKRCHPQRGDLLLTKVGTTGIPVLINTDCEFSIFVSVALIKFSKANISGEYLSMLVRSPFVKKQSADGTQGVGNKNLVLKTISKFILVIPPLTEQNRIVTKINELFTLCDQLKERLAQSQQTQLQLTDTLVTEALNG